MDYSNDLVQQLRERSTHLCDGSAIYCEAPCALLEWAANEIERLRSFAGAVTAGPSAAETLAPLRHKAPDTK